MDQFDLTRFLDAQAGDYATVLAELRAGEKRSHWMWYVFPQLRGLGRSDRAHYYGISSLEEARAYAEDRVLGALLRECVKALLALPPTSADDVLGAVDAQKLRSSLTLFRLAVPGEKLFGDALERYFRGQMDPQTIAMLEG